MSAPEKGTKVFSREEIDQIFGEIADKRIAAALTEVEKKSVADQESRKTALRAEFADLIAKGRDSVETGESKEELQPMAMLGQFATAAAKVAARAGTAAAQDKKEILKAFQETFPGRKTFANILQKDLEAGIPSAGGIGIPSILSPDLIRLLYNKTILDQVGAMKVPMPNGNFKMARMDVGDAVNWIGEIAGPQTPSQPVFGDISLTAKKLGAFVPVSNSLLRYNAVGLDSWVMQDLTMQARIALDKAALYGAGTAYTPRGIALQSGIQTSGTTGTSFALTTPVTMTELLEIANVPMINPYWVLHPYGVGLAKSLAFSSGPFAWANEMNVAKTLNGIPFVKSASVAYNSGGGYADFWLADFSEFVWGVGYDLSLEISREATYVNGGTTYSCFQRDETMIRLIAEHDFNIKHPVSFLQGTYKN